MEAVGATASFIAISQAVATIPKLITLIRSVAHTREGVAELLFEVEILTALLDQAQLCLNLLQDKEQQNAATPTQPANIQLIRVELEQLLSQLNLLAGDCKADAQQRVSMKTKAKWIWHRAKITELCEKSRRIQNYIQSFVNMLALRALVQDVRSQGKLLAEFQSRTTQRIASPDSNNDKCLPATRYQYPEPNLNVAKPCHCKCHSRSSNKSGWTAPIRSLLARDACSCNCVSRARRWLFKYQLPLWLTNRSIELVAHMGKANIGISLRLPEVLHDSYFWRIMVEGRQQFVRERIIERQIRPTDINIVGLSTLEAATLCNQWEVVLYWLRNHGGTLRDTSAIVNASIQARHLMEADDLSDRGIYACHLLIELSEQEDAPSMIHEAIRKGEGLAHAVACQPSMINDMADTGMTPLQLACWMEDFDALLNLVQYGADVHRKDYWSRTPLHQAVFCESTRFAGKLLEAGADINATNPYGQTPLTTILSSTLDDNEIAMTEYLVLHGASVQIVDFEGKTVLHELGGVQNANQDADQIELCFRVLAGAGALEVLERRDHFGRTALLEAVTWDNSEMTRLLLSHEAQIDVFDNSGQGVMHLAALFATIGTLSILSNARITGIDVRTPSFSGYTALSMLWFGMHMKSHELPGFRCPSKKDVQAFTCLLRDIRDRSIMKECAEVENLISMIREGDAIGAQQVLATLRNAKLKVRIDEEAETFRAIALDIRKGDLKLAIESLEDYIAASKARLGKSLWEDIEGIRTDDDSVDADTLEDGHSKFSESYSGGDDASDNDSNSNDEAEERSLAQQLSQVSLAEDADDESGKQSGSG